MRIGARLVLIFPLTWFAGAGAQAAPAADTVVLNARIYTADSSRSIAEALAVSDDKVVFVGSNAEAARWVGPNTRTLRLSGQLVLPALIDSHVL